MVKYIQFLESYLGEIDYGWKEDADGQELSFHVVKYKSGPFPRMCNLFNTWFKFGKFDKS